MSPSCGRAMLNEGELPLSCVAEALHVETRRKGCRWHQCPIAGQYISYCYALIYAHSTFGSAQNLCLRNIDDFHNQINVLWMLQWCCKPFLVVDFVSETGRCMSIEQRSVVLCPYAHVADGPVTASASKTRCRILAALNTRKK